MARTGYHSESCTAKPHQQRHRLRRRMPDKWGPRYGEGNGTDSGAADSQRQGAGSFPRFGGRCVGKAIPEVGASLSAVCT
jgi:hypothetical protein